MLRRREEFVINLPTRHLVDAAVGIGNCTGEKIDKLKKFGLTPVRGEQVGAPLIKECYANFECRLVDASQIPRHDLFIWEAVSAHVATPPERPETLHYRG